MARWSRSAEASTGDGRRDLFGYGPDVFASIANYFVKHGWRTGEPVDVRAKHVPFFKSGKELRERLNADDE